MKPREAFATPARDARFGGVPAVMAVLIFLLVFALFSPSLRYGLVDLDDLVYVANNTVVLDGLTPASVRQAFAVDNASATMYMPLLWLSYMLDVEWLGATPDRPWGFHFTNVLLHALNSAVLFLLLFAFCRRPWRALFLAALWAVHPLRVESVAWVTERKDVLSGLFALLCIGAYVRAWKPTATPSSASVSRPAPGRVLAALVFFALGLLVKPSLVPLPLILLLLDFWPLRRAEFSGASLRRMAPRLLLEKTPFFLLAALAAGGTVFTHHVVTGAMPTPLGLRLQAIPLAYGHYLLKTILPINLTVLYLPFADCLAPVRLWTVLVFAVLLLGSLTILAWRARARSPNQLAGWLWFVLMLAPVCGLVPIPANEVADRFTYLPAIGLSLALLFPDPFPKKTRLRVATSFALAGILAILSLRQLPAWKDTAALYSRVLAVFPRHPTALKNRATQIIRETGDFKTANEMVSTALAADPRHWEAHFAKAQCLAELEGPAAARRHLLQIVPPPSIYARVDWFRDLARYALMLGEYDEAIRYADQAMALVPPHSLIQTPLLLLALAAAYEKGDQKLALAYAHRFPPYAHKTSLELADLLPHAVFQWVGGYRRDAYAFFQRLVKAYPDNAYILNNLAWGLATAAWSPADAQEVLAWATRLSALVPTPNPGILDTVAVAQANAGDFDAAMASTQEALARLPSDGNPTQLLFQKRLAARLALYREHRPYREDAFTRMYLAYFGEISRLREPEAR